LNSSSLATRILVGQSKRVYAREMRGIVLDDQNCVFERRMLERFIARPRRMASDMDLSGLAVYSQIDPTGGSDKQSSHLAIVSIIRMPDMSTLIVGLASRPVGTEDEMSAFIASYFRASAEAPHLQGLTHYVMEEDNYG